MTPYTLGFLHGIAAVLAVPVVGGVALIAMLHALRFVLRFVDPQRTEGGFAVEIGPDTYPARPPWSFGWGFSRKTPLSLRPARHDHHLPPYVKTIRTWCGFFVARVEQA